MPTQLSILTDDTQCRELEEFLTERLYKFNSRATGLFDGRLLGISIRNETGDLIAGISGNTWGHCAELSHVWVREHERRQGLGIALLQAAESEAIRRECTKVTLRTHSFQAPEFYLRCGYEKAHVIEDKPKGHSDVLFTKTLPVTSPVSIVPHEGPRAELRALFELAEDSSTQLESYWHEGCVWVARMSREPIGYIQVMETSRPGEAEIKSLAVRASYRCQGIGRALIETAAQAARDAACSHLLVATASADIGNLRFYQRTGFRMRSIDRDAFTTKAGYPPGLRIDGIALCDRVWFERRL